MQTPRTQHPRDIEIRGKSEPAMPYTEPFRSLFRQCRLCRYTFPLLSTLFITNVGAPNLRFSALFSYTTRICRRKHLLVRRRISATECRSAKTKRITCMHSSPLAGASNVLKKIRLLLNDHSNGKCLHVVIISSYRWISYVVLIWRLYLLDVDMENSLRIRLTIFDIYIYFLISLE